MIRKVALYFAFIAGLAMTVSLWRGIEPSIGRAIGALAFAVAASFGIWLRWDWAPAKRRERLGAGERPS